MRRVFFCPGLLYGSCGFDGLCVTSARSNIFVTDSWSKMSAKIKFVFIGVAHSDHSGLILLKSAESGLAYVRNDLSASHERDAPTSSRLYPVERRSHSTASRLSLTNCARPIIPPG